MGVMMIDVSQLVTRLREIPGHTQFGGKAADTIEAQAREIAALTARAEDLAFSLFIERAITDGTTRRDQAAEKEANDCGAERAAWKDRAEAAEAELRGFLAVWAAKYGADFFGSGTKLHPTHYDRLAELGARMDDFTRADIGGGNG